MAAPNGRLAVVIENQYMGKNVQSAISLAHRAGRWDQACRKAGLGVPIYLMASVWQQAELLHRGRREQLEKMAAAKARSLFARDGRIFTPDEACAALMGRYVLIHGGT